VAGECQILAPWKRVDYRILRNYSEELG
jgi:hypothetical protein